MCQYTLNDLKNNSHFRTENKDKTTRDIFTLVEEKQSRKNGNPTLRPYHATGGYHAKPNLQYHVQLFVLN